MFGTQVSYLQIYLHNPKLINGYHFHIVVNRKRDMSTNHMPVGAFHLRGGINTVERSETFPSSFGSLSAFCRTLYRISRGYMGL